MFDGTGQAQVWKIFFGGMEGIRKGAPPGWKSAPDIKVGLYDRECDDDGKIDQRIDPFPEVGFAEAQMGFKAVL